MACDTTLQNQQKLDKKHLGSIGQLRCYCDCRFVKAQKNILAQQKGFIANNGDPFIEVGRRHPHVCG